MCKRNIRWENVNYSMMQCGKNKSRLKTQGYKKAQP